jgi:sulfur-carrier protein
MPQVRFRQNIQRHVACPPREVEGSSSREALEAYFKANPPARSYVFDDQGALRKHMAIFINGDPVLDRTKLAFPRMARLTCCRRFPVDDWIIERRIHA